MWTKPFWLSQPFVLSRSWLGRESHRRRHHHYLEKKIGNQSSSNEEEGVDRIGTLCYSLKRHTSLSKDSRLWNFVCIYVTFKKLIHRQESFVALPELFCKFYLICFNMEMIGTWTKNAFLLNIKFLANRKLWPKTTWGIVLKKKIEIELLLCREEANDQ